MKSKSLLLLGAAIGARTSIRVFQRNETNSRNKFRVPFSLCVLAGAVFVAAMARGQCLTPPEGLVAWWPGDGNANDIQGPTFENGTNQTGTSFGAGKVAQAFDFNGASGGVVIGDPVNLRITNQITLDAWVNPRSIPIGNSFGLAGVITKWVVNTATESWGLWLARSGSDINVASDFGDGASGSVLFGGNVPTNQWSHIATTYNSSTDEHKIYINGVQVASRILPGAIVTSDIPVVIGNQATASVPFDGLIDEVEIFSRALNSSEITAIHNAGADGKCKPASPRASGTVLTIAGNGSGGFSGDGGPAITASFNGPHGMAIGPDGTIYVVDGGNFRIRGINLVTGIITTVAGNGTIGATGNDGPATNAALSSVLAIAVDGARNALYIGDIDNNWARKVDLTTGLLTRYAGTGTFGFGGDGGPATSAQFSFAHGVATDAAGRLFIADVFNNRIRRVDPVTGIITTIAGNGGTVSAGDGGPATNASFELPLIVALDSAGNVFVADEGANSRVRRIDAATGIITTVAGGGAATPGSGPATNMNLGNASITLAVNDAGTLFLASGNRVFKVDLATGLLSPFAGAANAGAGGDGGPALDARFNGIDGLALAAGGGLIISDRGNNRIRYIAPASITLTNDSQQTAFHLPWVNSLSGDFIVAGNSNLTTVNAGAVTNVAGSVDITGNTSATTIDLGSLTSAGGNVDITGNDTATTIDLGSLASAGGNVDITDNDTATTIDLSSLASAGGNVDITGNDTATTIDLGSLASAGGNVDITDNDTATTIDLSSLASAGGNVDITGNDTATTIDLGSLASAGGSVDITGNDSATTIDLGSLASVGGDLTVSSNAPNTVVNLASLSRFGGGTNATTITLQGGTFTFSNSLTIASNATLAGAGTLATTVTNAGKLAPGRSPGRFDITGNLVLTGSSELRLELGGDTPGTQFDFLNVAGNVTLSGTLAVSLINNFPSVMTNGASFALLTAGSPLAGTFANAASGGTLTTTDGYARFTVLYAGETTVRLTGLVIVDTDNDGLPDWWEDHFSLNKTNSADAALDLDGDGAFNANEFRAGTVPTNSASVFRIVALQRESNGVRLTWSTVGGKSYRVQTNASLTDPFVDLSPLITVPGIGESTTNLVDSNAVTNAPARYYRVRLGP